MGLGRYQYKLFCSHIHGGGQQNYDQHYIISGAQPSCDGSLYNLREVYLFTGAHFTRTIIKIKNEANTGKSTRLNEYGRLWLKCMQGLSNDSQDSIRWHQSD